MDYNANRKKQLAALKNTRATSHSGGNFLQHLFGVFDILRAWGAPEEVYLAGLYHSIYGTEFFQKSTVDKQQRQSIQALIGVPAERLAYAFCSVRRNEILPALLNCSLPEQHSRATLNEINSHNTLQLTALELEQLLLIEMANLLDQLSDKDRSPAIFIWRLVEMAESISFLPPQHPALLSQGLRKTDEIKALEAYKQALTISQPDNAKTHLKKAIGLNPIIGESYILLAAIELDSERFDSALYLASEGLQHLRTWASPWDKRLLLSDWMSLAERLIELACIGVRGEGFWQRLQKMLTNSHMRRCS
ncbi:DUF6817 domain-containing protein [Agaribacterium sp. ZY112]|uniref:DUF6817 domain-containing protein n=1 Tax=Agaribacterium sp. ZY112 TaxID=3233574 RepID=UPI0035236969